jgi:hypothetical protein
MVPEILVLALEYQRRPLSYAHLSDPGSPLPKTFDSLVGGVGAALSPARLQETADELGASPEALREAALFLVRHVLLVPGANHYRVLGLDPNAELDRIGEHYRTLVRFLHPDRLPPEQRQRAAQDTARLNAAYAVLKELDLRRRYDLEVATARRRRLKRGAGESIPLLEPRGPRSWTQTHWLLAGSLALLLAMGLGVAAMTSRPALRVTVDPNQVQAPRPAFLETAPTAANAPNATALASARPNAEALATPHQVIERLEASIREGDLGVVLTLMSEDAQISRGGLPEQAGAGALIQGILTGDLRLVEVRLIAADEGRYLADGRLALAPSAKAGESAAAEPREGRVQFEIAPRSNGYRISAFDYRIKPLD